MAENEARWSRLGWYGNSVGDATSIELSMAVPSDQLPPHFKLGGQMGPLHIGLGTALLECLRMEVDIATATARRGLLARWYSGYSARKGLWRSVAVHY